MEFGIRPHLLPSKIRHVHGPRHVSNGLEELVVISVVRNGELYIKSFLNHYRTLGVKHFVFLDNQSSDRTLELLCLHNDFTVLRTDAPYKEIREHHEEISGAEFLSGQVEFMR